MPMFNPEPLIEAVPYLLKFRQSIFVIKMGGSFLEDVAGQKAFIEDIALLSLLGIQIVVIHGGGKAINEKLKNHGIESQFIEGYRVTDEKTMDVVEMTLSGSIGKRIVHQLQLAGIKAVGLNGKDGQMIQAEAKCLEKNQQKIDLGHVGNVVKVDTELLSLLIREAYIPVISPIGYDLKGGTYNLNADIAASAIAGALKAEKLILMTDVDGVYRAYPDESSLISQMTASECRRLCESQALKGGMIPKLTCAVEAIESQVGSVHIINGSKPHSLLSEIFSNEGIGTMIVKDAIFENEK